MKFSSLLCFIIDFLMSPALDTAHDGAGFFFFVFFFQNIFLIPGLISV